MRAASVGFLLGVLLPGFVLAQTREEKVLADRQKVEAEGRWIYGDLEKGFAEAKKAGKPLVVVLRCIPCEECVKLDDELIDENPRIKQLLDKFVCVRIVSTNGLDLSLFQFDYDQSFAVFLFHPDRTILGRFGTRSDRTEWIGDVSVAGMAEAMEGALALYQNYPQVKASLAGKQSPPPDFPSPEKYPLLSGKYGPRINYENNVVQSCIHCHQVGDAQREFALRGEKPISDKILFSYPHPKTLGLILDPDTKARVREVKADSLAEKAGFKPGDEIQSLAGQPPLSIADVQWVLHNASSSGASIPAVVLRDRQKLNLTLVLPDGWREQENIAWRVSSWPYRRKTTGGLLLETLPEEARGMLGLPQDKMALRVKHVGQYGPHAAAKRAGFQTGDIVIAYDNQSNLPRETDLMAYALRNLKPGATVPVKVLRGGKELELKLPIQQ